MKEKDFKKKFFELVAFDIGKDGVVQCYDRIVKENAKYE